MSCCAEITISPASQWFHLAALLSGHPQRTVSMQTWQLLQAFRSELKHLSLRTLEKQSTLPPRCVRASQFRAYSSVEELKDTSKSTLEPAGADQDNTLGADTGSTLATGERAQVKKSNGKARWRARQRATKQEELLNDLLTVKEDVESPEDTIDTVSLAELLASATTTPASTQTGIPDRAILTSRQSVSAALPKPSFLRPTLQDRMRADLLVKYPQKPRRSGSQSNPHGKTVKKSLSAAPFSTAFSQNPFAHALASPVREDSLSRIHLPMSCLLDFHIAELDPEEVPSDEVKKNVKGSGKDETVQYSLLPLSLATELTQKTEEPTYRPLVDSKRAEQGITAAQRAEASSPRPTGSSSYLTSTYDALRFISEDPKRRLASNALSRRMHATIGTTRNMQPNHIKWMPEMPDLVQSALRRIVVKKLGYLLKSKGARDKPGLVCEVAGGGQALQGLGRIEDVSCVVQLCGEVDDYPVEGSTSTIAQRWRDYPFLDHVNSLSAQSPATARTSTLSTIQYRNIKVPIYSLPALLGEEMAEKLVSGTVFAEGGRIGTKQEISEDGSSTLKQPTRYIVLTRSNGTLQAHMWLLKLQSFLGGAKH
jgi:hypothetical protein